MEAEKKRFYQSLILPAFFVVLIWLVKIAELTLDIRFIQLAVYPLKVENLHGILTSPLVHSDLGHLAANTAPLLVLGVGLFFFYRPIAPQVFILIYLLSGIMLWLGGRPGNHIGASGLIYGLASFLFFSGVLRQYIRLMAISLLVVFLYGGLIWGILPVDPTVSWEGHLYGGIVGLVLAFYYKSEGPQRKKYEWEIEEEMEEMGEDWDEYDWEIYNYYRNKKKKEK
ncbi:MAG: rhomboid family intramembrane serine protease [Bacteroidales bacterium]